MQAVRQEDRLGLILRQLNQSGSVGVAALAGELQVSEASVRRDLHLLESQKLLTRTHGGAPRSEVRRAHHRPPGGAMRKGTTIAIILLLVVLFGAAALQLLLSVGRG